MALHAPSLATTSNLPVRRALLSVTDKAGLVEFARGLAAMGVELVSTGGTAKLLADAGLPVVGIEQVTGFPEIMHGRVKTLHPKVHGGLLGLRDHPEHAAAMRDHAITAIDLVCVNLYEFEKTVAKPGCTRADAIENIDIGGPSMIRSGAKNHAYVTVVTDPADYPRVLEAMKTGQGCTSPDLRAELAAKAFAVTAAYDAAIASYLLGQEDRFPSLLALRGTRSQLLRYGENPHQAGASYVVPGASGPSIGGAEQLHGKELSFNNINDAAAALELVVALKRLDPAGASACCVKHTNPCGAAMVTKAGPGQSAARLAVEEAIAGDPVAAFGGIIAVNVTIDEAAAERLCGKDVFLEVLIAPDFTPGALDLLRARWQNLRLLKVGPIDPAAAPDPVEFKSIPGGVLVQERDLRWSTREERRHAAGPAPAPAMVGAAGFLEVVGRFLFSNAVVIGGFSPEHGEGVVRMFGAGAGQMDRVTSCRLATEKAGALAKGACVFSDAFFPFADGPAILADAGVACIMHPGGSKRDQETLDLCDQRGITCLMSGLRHFRH
jgi:phosphoribosylaminoimidazolecarboxamide formyltransferase/IMP cyclohydrolase